MPGQMFYQNIIDEVGSRLWTVEQVMGGSLCAKTLEVPMTCLAREHVQKLQMARRVIAVS
jgi:hypothetical protein